MADGQIAVVDYISAAKAAEILGISKRRVLEYVQAGALQSRRQRDVETRQVAVQVHAGDVERLREERENPRPQPSQAPARQNRAAPEALARGFETARRDAGCTVPQALALREGARSQGSALPPSELAVRLWLTEDEAVAYTGLGRGYLRSKLTPQKIGPRGAAVYRRAELEGL